MPKRKKSTSTDTLVKIAKTTPDAESRFSIPWAANTRWVICMFEELVKPENHMMREALFRSDTKVKAKTSGLTTKKQFNRLAILIFNHASETAESCKHYLSNKDHYALPCEPSQEVSCCISDLSVSCFVILRNHNRLEGKHKEGQHRLHQTSEGIRVGSSAANIVGAPHLHQVSFDFSV